MLYQSILAPFSEPAVRSALVAVVSLALGAGPVGVFLMLRRMSLMGDTMAHAILPGVAVGFLVAGADIFAMTFGGLINPIMPLNSVDFPAPFGPTTASRSPEFTLPER